MTVLGARWEAPKPGTIRVHGIGRGHTFVDLPRFDCGESGSTLRFLIPIALAVAGGRCVHRPRPADGTSPGALRGPIPGAGNLLGTA